MGIKIKYFKPNELERKVVLYIHRSGKMGFSAEAAAKFDLAIGKSAGIGQNEEDPEDQTLYMVIYPGLQSEAFRVSKAGNYFYINTKLLFDNLKMDYEEGQLAFEVSEIEVEGQKVFALKRKERQTVLSKVKATEIEVSSDIEDPFN